MEEKVPMKWKKHLMLVEFGLRTMENLQSEIHRFNYNEKEILIEELKERIKCDKNEGIKRFYIVSLIPMQEYYKLPNIIIKEQEDIYKLEQLSDVGQFSEIWFCQKNLDSKNNNFVGRIVIKDTFDSDEQVLEQVWNCSHREIEKWNKDSEVDYIRASRDGWARRYRMECINITKSDMLDRMKEQFVNVVTDIENNREKIEIFMNHLKSIGINELCLEYMNTNHGIQFIDWDTSNDKKVIESIFNISREFEEIER